MNLACLEHDNYTLCLKKRANVETAWLEIIGTDFDGIWLKCSEGYRVQFACFSFHVGLLFCQLFVFQTGHRK